MQRLPGWFRAVFTAVMFLTCAVVCWYAVQQYDLRFQIADLTLSLDTSRQREVKQQYEYDQVVAELPLVQAQVAEMEPQAAAAQAIEKELRAQRKALRAAKADLEAQLELLQAEVDALKAREAALQAEVNALRKELEALEINTPGV